MKPPPAGIIVLVQTSTESFFQMHPRTVLCATCVPQVNSHWCDCSSGASLNTKFVILWKCIELICFNMRDRLTEVANGRFKDSSGCLETSLQSATFDHRDSSTWLNVQQTIPIICWWKTNNIFSVLYYFQKCIPKAFHHIMIVRWKKPAKQLAQP